jgi:hypothetical protein
MKRHIALFTGMAVVSWLAFVAPAFGANNDKEVTITGEGKCAKCMLKETDKCQTVIQVNEGGKTVNYYLAKNDVSKNFHENVCTDAKKVTATGMVKEEGGKKEFVATKIELVH